jgi:PAS domain S-box-containing protein
VTTEDAASERQQGVPRVLTTDDRIAAALGGADVAMRVDTATTAHAVAAADADALVCWHEPPGTDATALVDRVREDAPGLPVVYVLPDGVGPEAVPDAAATDYVRAVGDWGAHLARRVTTLVERAPARALAEGADAGLLLHPEDSPAVLAANDAFYEMLDYDPASHDLTIEDVVAGEGPFTRERAAELVRETLASGPQSFEWLDETSDGEAFWVEVTLRPTTVGGEDHVVATVRDIDERKAREEEAAAAEERRESTLERVTDAFFGLDEAWQFTYVNERAAELLEVDRVEVLGEAIWSAFPRAVDTVFEREYREAMERQEPTAFESYYPPLETWFEVHAYPAPDGLSVYFRDVTDRKEREFELEAYEQLVENVRDKLFVLDEECRFGLVTEPLAAWLGHDRADLEGADAVPYLTQESDTAGATALRLAVEAGQPATFETGAVVDGGRTTVEVELSPLGDESGRRGGAVGSVRDVTDRRDRERSHDALVDNVPGMVYRRGVHAEPTGAEGLPGMTFVSDACRSLTGHDPTALTEGAVDWVRDVVHPEERERVADRVRTAITAEEPFTLEYRITTPDGPKWVRDLGKPVTDGDGRMVAVEGLVTDITERTTRERHRRVLTRVLRHNVRNSVQVVSGFATEIRDRARAGDWDTAATDGDHTVADLATAIIDRAESLEAMSEQARRIEQAIEATEGAIGTVDAAALCRETVAVNREAHPEATVSLSVPDRLPVRAEADLKRAIDALVENAIVHTDGDATVRVSAGDADRDGWVAIRVADDGPGLPEREQAVLSGEREITQLVHGRGLGLWLVTWLVESYGGEVRFATDGGTTVTLLLRRGSA